MGSIAIINHDSEAQRQLGVSKALQILDQILAIMTIYKLPGNASLEKMFTGE